MVLNQEERALLACYQTEVDRIERWIAEYQLNDTLDPAATLHEMGCISPEVLAAYRAACAQYLLSVTDDDCRVMPVRISHYAGLAVLEQARQRQHETVYRTRLLHETPRETYVRVQAWATETSRILARCAPAVLERALAERVVSAGVIEAYKASAERCRDGVFDAGQIMLLALLAVQEAEAIAHQCGTGAVAHDNFVGDLGLEMDL